MHPDDKLATPAQIQVALIKLIKRHEIMSDLIREHMEETDQEGLPTRPQDIKLWRALDEAVMDKLIAQRLT